MSLDIWLPSFWDNGGPIFKGQYVQEEYPEMQCHMPEEQAPECNDHCPWRVWNYLRLLNPSAWMFKNFTLMVAMVVFFKHCFCCMAHDLNLC